MSNELIKASDYNPAVRAGTIDGKSVTNLRNNLSEQTQNLERQQQIEIAAAYYAEQRGINSGYEVRDWLKAEAEIDSFLRPAGY